MTDWWDTSSEASEPLTEARLREMMDAVKNEPRRPKVMPPVSVDQWDALFLAGHIDIEGRWAIVLADRPEEGNSDQT